MHVHVIADRGVTVRIHMEDKGVTEFNYLEKFAEYIRKISNESFAIYYISDSFSVHRANKELKG